MNDFSNKTRYKISLPGLTLFIFLLLAGCRGQSARVDIPEPVETQLETQKVELRNCESKTALHKSLASLVEIEKVITISPTATSPTSGEQIQISSQLENQLISEVDQAYRQKYEQAAKALEEVELVVPVGKIRTFEIEWIQQKFTSTIYFTVDQEEYAAEYTYQICIPHDVGYVEMSCTA
jgi:uncharacterized protein (DUF1499 family)